MSQSQHISPAVERGIINTLLHSTQRLDGSSQLMWYLVSAGWSMCRSSAPARWRNTTCLAGWAGLGSTKCPGLVLSMAQRASWNVHAAGVSPATRAAPPEPNLTTGHPCAARLADRHISSHLRGTPSAHATPLLTGIPRRSPAGHTLDLTTHARILCPGTLRQHTDRQHKLLHCKSDASSTPDPAAATRRALCIASRTHSLTRASG